MATAPLLKTKLTANVQPMRYWHLLRALDTTAKAFANGSLVNYLDLPDATPIVSNVRRWLFRLIVFAGGIYQRHMLTVGRGAAFVLYGTPHKGKSPWFVGLLLSILGGSKATEFLKRKNEYHTAMDAQVKEVFGASVDDMYEIQALATAPEAQRRGYASQLVKVVTDMGDADGHDTWVTTSDGHAFYEAQGFSVLRVVTLGTDNPAWNGGPVNVHLMRRKAKAPVLEETSSTGVSTAVG